MHPQSSKDRTTLAATVSRLVHQSPVYDIHTHLFEPAFGSLLLWGIDDLLVYHYLVAEAFRYLDLSYEEFWSLPKNRQADLVWNSLFSQRTPISEACRGVVTVLNALGIDLKKRDLPLIRKWFATWKPQDYVDKCMELARVHTLCMTNSPFDDQERAIWERGFIRDERFTAALRLDPLLLAWPETARRLASWGYRVRPECSAKTLAEVRRFLADWILRLKARYLMVSLPPEFHYPNTHPSTILLENAVLPQCREQGLPLAVMLGAKRAVNPALRLAGDGVGPSRMEALENLCVAFPENRFLATVLSRENQHALCVLTRKFRNLHPFGCWWFTNVPLLINEITRLRLELVGLSITPQHSDARVLDQLIYKWSHFRDVLAQVLTDKYADLATRGWTVPPDQIQRDVQALLGGEFIRFCDNSHPRPETRPNSLP